MALADLSDPEAVRHAIAEFEESGRDAFLKKYGFAPAKEYFVVFENKQYDSKAVAGVAHLYQHGVLLKADAFSGGDSTVANRLERLGFRVTRPVSLPDWSIDELMLALDLYLRTRGRISYSPTTKVVTDLSTELRSLRVFPATIRARPRFRNPLGVALKLHNFSSIDPSRQSRGMDHGGPATRRSGQTGPSGRTSWRTRWPSYGSKVRPTMPRQTPAKRRSTRLRRGASCSESTVATNGTASWSPRRGQQSSGRPVASPARSATSTHRRPTASRA
ncbi:hypothetical protein [Auraticoccus cholistanensis]|uniref:hypothetical protein n=1 Tax=Auraticoccus cholistanensis TaxID=2656650 RepID=UPI001E3E3041|nr:hypothetical protein [Auraticoccus cholistanensis]